MRKRPLPMEPKCVYIALRGVALLAVAVLSSGCSVAPKTSAPPPPPPAGTPSPGVTYFPAPVNTYRAFLQPGQFEPLGLALYSYLLFQEDTSDSNRALRLQLIKVFLEISIAPPVGTGDIPLAQRNLLFLPVKPAIAQCGPQPSSDCVLAQYDLEASRSLLRRIDSLQSPRTGHTQGPYLIAATAPIGALAPGQLVLDWNLYHVTTDVVALKMDMFEQQVRGPISAPVAFLNTLLLKIREGVGFGSVLLQPILPN